MATVASYPSTVVNFGLDRINTIDIIQAADPNTLRAEVVAIETTVGTSPSLATAATASGWANTATDYGTVTARLANIEKGIVADTHSQYVKNAGGSAIVAGSSSTIGLSIAAASGQTADLMQWKNSSGTVVTRVGPDGVLNSSNVFNFTGQFLLGGM